jgi:nitrile hydratase accessory protein
MAAPGFVCPGDGRSRAYPGYALAKDLGIPSDDSGSVFSQPWHAQAVAIVYQLHKDAYFTWKEWTECLSVQIAKSANERLPAVPEQDFYLEWLDALERIACEKGLTDRNSVTRMNDAWAAAAARTPHGSPIALDGPEAAGGLKSR